MVLLNIRLSPFSHLVSLTWVTRFGDQMDRALYSANIDNDSDEDDNCDDDDNDDSDDSDDNDDDDNGDDDEDDGDEDIKSDETRFVAVSRVTQISLLSPQTYSMIIKNIKHIKKLISSYLFLLLRSTPETLFLSVAI